MSAPTFPLAISPADDLGYLDTERGVFASFGKLDALALEIALTAAPSEGLERLEDEYVTTDVAHDEGNYTLLDLKTSVFDPASLRRADDDASTGSERYRLAWSTERGTTGPSIYDRVEKRFAPHGSWLYAAEALRALRRGDRTPASLAWYYLAPWDALPLEPTPEEVLLDARR